MEIASIQLEPDDDIATIRDRLEWVEAQRIVLVLPADGELLTDRLDQALLRRQAERIGKEVGLVSLDPKVARYGREVGLAPFRSVRASRSRLGQRQWRRAARTPPPGVAGHHAAGTMDAGDWRAMYRRMSALPTWRAWLTRYVAIFLFFSTVSILLVTAVYTIPGATITFHPLTKPIRVVLPLTADAAGDRPLSPGPSRTQETAGSIPARLVPVTVQWRSTAAASGILEIPDAPARGQVIFANVLGERVAVPAGTRVLASGGRNVVYQTMESVTVPNGLGATAEADVMAIEPGTLGNVPANVVNRIAGPLSLQLAVRNLEPIEGGAARQVAAVTDADRERLRAHVVQYLYVIAGQELNARLLADELLVEDSLQLLDIEHESFSHFAGEQSDSLTLEMRASIQGIAIDPSQANGLVYEAVAAAMDDGFALIPESLTVAFAGVERVDDSGKVHFTMIGEAVTAARLDRALAIEAISGREPGEASAFLYRRLPLARRPLIEVQPSWFERVPYLPARTTSVMSYE